jgi:acetyl esterase/lipase
MNDELAWYTRAWGALERTGFDLVMGVSWARNRLANSWPRNVDGRELAPEMAAMLWLDNLTERSDLRKLSPPAARRRVADDLLVVDAPAPPGVDHHDVEFDGPAGSIRVRCYTPAGLSSPSPAVVFFHGGGWVTGSIGTHDGACRRLALGAACRVFSIGYRLAPEHRFPAAVDDCVAAFRWAIQNAAALGIDSARVGVAGDSAGGNLSAVVSQVTNADPIVPRVALLLYPALDMTARMRSHETVGEKYFLTLEMIEWYYAHYMGDADRRDPRASPLLAEAVPKVPTLIHTCGFDPLRDEGRAYADRLGAAGVSVRYTEHREFVHGFALMSNLEVARRAWDGVIDGLRAWL